LKYFRETRKISLFIYMSFLVHAPPMTSPSAAYPLQRGIEPTNTESRIKPVTIATPPTAVLPVTEARKAVSQLFVGGPALNGLLK
jgi:hypothetical protein